MIKTIRVRGFQSQYRFDLDLGPGVTTILGPTDSGKSALLRALRWLCCNVPRGGDFVSWGVETCSVEIDLDKGRTVARSTGKGGNTYTLDGGEPYKSFGPSVPDEVARLLNVDNSLNFQGQLDPPFWFWLSPGEVSRELNRIVDLERIDQVLSRCAGMLRQTRDKLQLVSEQQRAAEEERDKYAWTVQAIRDWKEIEVLQRDNELKRTELGLLEDLIEEATQLALRQQVLADAKADAEELTQVMERNCELATEAAELEELVKEVEEACASDKRAARERRAAEESLKKDAGETCPACGKPFAS